jgi:hypothetical protein
MEGRDMVNVNAVVAVRVLALVADGMNAVEALKAVCGAENVDAMIDALYHELRKEVA